jgi:hypothetical protein
MKDMSFLTVEEISSKAHDAAGLQRMVLERLESGEGYQICTSNNPTLMVMDLAASLAEASITESRTLTAAQYPAMANNMLELSRFMSGDGIEILQATPATGEFIVGFALDSFMKKAPALSTGELAITLPRNMSFNDKGYKWLLEYPINVVRLLSGSMVATYDYTIEGVGKDTGTEVAPITITNIEGNPWVLVSSRFTQLNLESTHDAVHPESVYNKVIYYSDQFAGIRVWTRSGVDWKEVPVSLSRYTYVSSTPSVVVTVEENTITIHIPFAFVESGALIGQVRFDLYTTKGAINVDYRGSTVSGSDLTFAVVDTSRDNDEYTAVVSGLDINVVSPSVISDGKSRLSFKEVKSLVQLREVGHKSLPITSGAVAGWLSRYGYVVSAEYDNITSRVYSATRSLPPPSSKELILPAPTTMVIVSLPLQSNDDWHGVTYLDGGAVVSAGSLLRLSGGQPVRVSPDEIAAISKMDVINRARYLNDNTLAYNPFTYVADWSGDSYDVRVYDLSSPTALVTNWGARSTTSPHDVEPIDCLITKVTDGYLIKVRSRYIKERVAGLGVINTTISVLIGGETLVIRGDVIGADETNIVHEYPIYTTGYVTKAGEIQSKGWGFREVSVTALLPLKTEFTVTFMTSQNRVLGAGVLNATLGDDVEVATRNVMVVDENLLPRYEEDVPARYKKGEPRYAGQELVVLGGVIRYPELGVTGEAKTDKLGNTIYLHRAGELIPPTDENYPHPTAGKKLMIEMVAVDAKYLFATDKTHQDYLPEVSKTIRLQAQTLSNLTANKLLEKTKVLYKCATNIGWANIRNREGGTDMVRLDVGAELVFVVPQYVYTSLPSRDSVKETTVRKLDEILSTGETDDFRVVAELLKVHGGLVTAIRVIKFLDTMQGSVLIDSNDRLSIRRRLSYTPAGTTIVENDVNIRFVPE